MRTEGVLDHTAVHYQIPFDDYEEFYSVQNHHISDAETTRNFITDYIRWATWAWWMITTDADLLQQDAMNYISKADYVCDEVQRDTCWALFPNLYVNNLGCIRLQLN